jgi:hypothetical protein
LSASAALDVNSTGPRFETNRSGEIATAHGVVHGLRSVEADRHVQARPIRREPRGQRRCYQRAVGVDEDLVVVEVLRGVEQLEQRAVKPLAAGEVQCREHAEPSATI